MDQLKDWFPILGGLLAFVANWGTVRATLDAFRREVNELKEAAKPIVELRTQAAVFEVRLTAAEKTIAELREELQHVHDAAKAEIASLRVELSELRRDVLREPTRPG